MHAVGLWRGGYQTLLNDARGHTTVVDLPSDEGGSDAGTSALELSVLALAGCISTIFALVARKRRLADGALKVDLTAQRPERSPTISEVNGIVQVLTSASREDVQVALSLTL